MKTCKHCKGNLPNKSNTYCSKSCREQAELSRINFENRNCKNCGNEFIPKKANQVYCSTDCSSIFHRLKYNSIRLTNFNIFQRDNFTCIYCGKSSIEDKVKLHVDHIYPLAKGGKATIENLVTACEKCNVSKQHTVLHSDILNRLLSEVSRRNKNLLDYQREAIISEIQMIAKVDELRSN
jgi:ribosomal protein S27AE